MRQKILKIMGVFAAGMLISGITGCGAKAPTKTDDLTQEEQQKLKYFGPMH